MNRRKKKGSTLITVVIIFAILITIGTSVLALTVGDYKVRVAESNKAMNLYSAESGLDVADGIIAKVTEYAVKEGNKAAEDYLSEINASGGLLDKEREKVNNDETSSYINKDGTINQDKIKEEQNNKFQDKYKGIIEQYIPICVQNGQIVTGADDAGALQYQSVTYPTDSDGNSPIIKFENGLTENKLVYDSTNDKYSFTLKSDFYTNNGSTGKPYERILQVGYDIKVPEYQGAYTFSSNKVQVSYNTAANYLMSVEGNLLLNNDTIVNGDVYVKGNSQDTGDFISSKYSGGIVADGKVDFKGNVITANTLQLYSGSADKEPAVTLEKKLYANNIYITGNNNSRAYSSSLTIGDEAVLNNDLTIKGEKSSVEIDSLYGINDLSSDSIKSNDPSINKMNSSCIIIDSNDLGQADGSSLKVKNNLYLMGNAYIKTDPNYQTGESIAVMGNYIGYSMPINDSSSQFDVNKVKFGYYSPLQLVDSYSGGTTFTAIEKSKYLTEYYNKNQSSSGIKVTGITLPTSDNILAYGVYPDGQALKNGYDSNGSVINLDKLDTINNKKADYVFNVYGRGENISGSTYSSPKIINPFYNINFPTENKVIDKDGYRIVITNSDYTLSDTTKSNMIIIAKGSVNLNNVKEFKGTIVCGGNLSINGNTTLDFDKDFVNRVVGENYDLFKGINFIDVPEDNSYNSILLDIQSLNKESSSIDIVNLQNIILRKKGSWKIIK